MKRSACLVSIALLSICIVACNKRSHTASSFLSDSSSSQALSSSSYEHIHRWGEPTYEWSSDNAKCTANVVCLDDLSHKETEEVDSSYVISSPAKCEIDGVGTYTANFVNPLFTSQTKNIALPKLGHDFIHHDGQASTCTEKGWNAYDTCSRCDYTSKVETDALGHEYARNEETLVYECIHEGCQATNGRDYEMSITIDKVHVGDLYKSRDYEFSFKNDNGNVVFGFVSYYIDGSTVINPSYGASYRFPNSYVGKTVKALIYLGIHNKTTVSLSANRQQIENCTVLCNGQVTTKGGRTTANSSDYYPSSEPSVIDNYFYNYHFDLGTVLPSEDPSDYEYSYQDQSFNFDHASINNTLYSAYLDFVTQAYNNSKVSCYGDNTLEFISDAQFDGSEVVNTPFIKYASIINLSVLPQDDGQFMLSGTCSYTSKLENEETTEINETGGFRRWVENDRDVLRLGFTVGGIQFFLWFTPTGESSEHCHLHHFVRDETTLEYYCDYEDCEATNGRDYEMTIELPTLRAGDVYDKWDATCTFKNDDEALSFVVIIYEIDNEIIPYTQSGTYEFLDSNVGQDIIAHVYIGVDDDTYVRFNESKNVIANLQIIYNDEPYSCSGDIGPYTSQSGKTYEQTFHYEIPYGTLQPRNS